MTIGDIITYIMLAFAVIGGVDRAFGSRLGPGQAFERGLESMGALVLAMLGPMALAPLLAEYLTPVLGPVLGAVGIDPSMVAGLFLSNDGGGWPLALELAQDEQVGKFAGSIVGAVMGCTIVGAFPMCFLLAPREKLPLVAKGLTVGIITIPVSCFVGGLCFGLPLGTLLINLLPEILLSGLIVVGLLFCEKITVKIVTIFGYVMTAVVTLALVASMVIKMLGLNVPNVVSFDECLGVIGSIAIFLCGAFTLLFFVEKLCGQLFDKIGRKTGMEGQSILGLLTTAVNAIPMFSMTKQMSDRGVIMNIAFSIPAAYLIGDHLAFQTSVDATTVVPTLVGKAAGGVLAVLLALWMTRPKKDAMSAPEAS